MADDWYIYLGYSDFSVFICTSFYDTLCVIGLIGFIIFHKHFEVLLRMRRREAWYFDSRARGGYRGGAYLLGCS